MGSPGDPEIRKSGIGSSDIAAIAGLSRYRTPLSACLEKRGEIPAQDLSDNEPVQWGVLFEDAIAKEWSRRTDKKIRKSTRTHRHPAHKFIMAHPDRLLVDEDAILEVKTTGQWLEHEWGSMEDEDPAIPLEYRLQVQHQLAVTGRRKAYLAVLIGGRELRSYEIARDEALIKSLVQLCVDFWERHVLGDELPPPITDEDLARLYPDAVAKKEIVADSAALEHHELLIKTRDHIKVFRRDEEEYVFALKSYMKDATELIGPEGVIATWRTNKKGKRMFKIRGGNNEISG